jgi:hypothetical protein
MLRGPATVDWRPRLSQEPSVRPAMVPFCTNIVILGIVNRPLDLARLAARLGNVKFAVRDAHLLAR